MGDDKLHDLEIRLVRIDDSDKLSHKKINEIENTIEGINQRVYKNTENLQKTNSFIESISKTVVEIQESFKSINSLAMSVHEIASEMKAMRTDINRVDIKSDNYHKSITERVKTIEDKPSKRYEAIIEKVILVIVGGIVGYLFQKFMGM